MANPRNENVEIRDQQVREYLRAIADRGDDPRPLLTEIGEILLASVQRNFEAQGRPEKWDSLSPVTIATRKRKRKWPGKILSRTGAAGLLGSVNYRVTQDSVKVGTKKKYATTMHYGAKKGEFGTVQAQVKAHVRKISKPGKKRKAKVQVKAHTKTMAIPWGDIPARPFMLAQDEDITAMRAVALEYMLGGNAT